MASSRTHTLSLALLVFGSLVLGFWLGSSATDLLLSRREKKSLLPLSAGAIRAKRMSAIRKAVKEGRSEYEFQVSGFQPIFK